MIESVQNDKIKKLHRLITDNNYRRKSGVFVVEGLQENQRALQFNYQAIDYFICKELFSETIPMGNIHYVSPKVYAKIAYRSTTEGIIGLYKTENKILTQYQPAKNATIIVLEGIEKPGNLGAILRSCEAFGIDAIIITNPKIDFFHPNVIRSSVGCLFGMNVFSGNNQEVVDFFQEKNIEICTTIMQENATHLHNIDLNRKKAIIFGTEHSGLSDFWENYSEHNMLIPMCGTIDSINLSNAVAITCYESHVQKKARIFRNGL